MRNVGNWIGELTTTTGIGPLTLGGALGDQFTTFADVGITSIEYSIVDGNNRETGLGTINGLILTRDVIHSTLSNGVYSGNSPGPLVLSGLAEVYSALSRVAFDEINTGLVKLSLIEDEAKDDQIALEVPVTPVGGLVATDVQSALAELDVEIANIVIGDTAIGDLTEVAADIEALGDIMYYNGSAWVLTNLNVASTIDLTADYDWTGLHTFEDRIAVNGNIIFDEGNINEAVLGVNTQTGASFTTVLSDAGGLITMGNANANVVTIPPNSSVAYPIGATLTGQQVGVGQTSLLAGAGVTLNVISTKGLLVSEQYGFWSAVQIATNVWSLAGDLTS